MRSGKLAGRTTGIHLNEEGLQQAAALGKRLAQEKLAAIYSSPLERTMETAQAIAEHHHQLQVVPDDGLLEVDYGQWVGQRLRKLARTRLWGIVQGYPSGARFPGGESFLAMQARIVSTLDRIAGMHPDGIVAAVSHADALKVAIANYAGMHLDLFQRITIGPASISIIDVGRFGPRLVCLNDTCHYKHPPHGASNE
jgi:probable phosphoglycerate mutase